MSFESLSTHIGNEVKRVLKWAAPKDNGRLCLVLDPSLSAAISRLIDLPTMRSINVKDMFELSGVEPLITDCENVLYIIRAEQEMIGRLAFQSLRLNSVKATAESDAKAPVYVAWVPNLTSICARQLENFGLYGRLQTTSLPALSINCLDHDLATFDDGVTFHRAFLENDPETVHAAVQTLVEIQQIYGPFGEVSGRGKVASTICQILCSRQQTDGSATATPSEGQGIARVICMDRTVDLVTPMLTSFTYEGVIDELIGIEMGYCKISADIVKAKDRAVTSQDGDQSDLVNCPLFSTDPIYARIRDESFPFVLSRMSALIKQVSSKLDQRNDAKEIAQLKGFMKCLPNYLSELDSVATHTNLLTHLATITTSPLFMQLLRTEDTLLNQSDLGPVLETIEYWMVQQEPWPRPVRLLCLWSQLYGGLHDNDYTACCSQLINNYGAAVMLPLISRLARTGLFYRKGDLTPRLNWKNVKRDLCLIADQSKPDDPVSPTDYHFVHGYCAYSPISVRIIERRIKDRTWAPVNNVTNRDEICFNKKLKMDSPGGGATLLVFIGGVTRSEVAAIRFLNSRQPESPYLICGRLITGTSLLQSMRMLSPDQQ